MTGKHDLTADLARFAQLHVASSDIDPAYPVLRRLYELTELTEKDALQFSVTYVDWYQLASAIRHQTGDRNGLPTGVERRNLRAHNARLAHIHSMDARLYVYGGVAEWLRPPEWLDPLEGWRHVRERFERVWGNGRWASYKMAEVLMKVHGWPIAAPDMGNDASSGPVSGLNLVLGTNLNNHRDVAQADASAEALRARLQNEHGVALGIEQLETVLCDFHALHDGRYYVGHDIDMMQAQLTPHISADHPVWRARRDTLPHAYLGELNGWAGADPKRRTEYRRTGRIVERIS